jgi:hypothetical protein
MARSRASFTNKFRKNAEPRILANLSGLRRLQERHKALSNLESPAAVLDAVRKLGEPTPLHGPILRALVIESRPPFRSALAVDILLWAFAPAITRKLRSVNYRDDKEDFEQCCVVGFLTEVATIDLSKVADDALASILCKGVHRGFLNTSRSERKGETAVEHFLRKGLCVGRQDAAGHRQRKQRIRFDEGEREEAKRILLDWIGGEVANDSRFGPWEAIQINGEPLIEYARRLATNGDEEIGVPSVNSLSWAKKRFNERIKEAIERSAEAKRVRLRLEIEELFTN